MSALKAPEIVLHAIFKDYDSDLSEIYSCVETFLDGDCGAIRDEDEILGFMKRSLSGQLRHGVYNTRTGGWVHVVGDNEKVMAMPDIIYAQGVDGIECSINLCACGSKHNPSPTKTQHDTSLDS